MNYLRAACATVLICVGGCAATIPPQSASVVQPGLPAITTRPAAVAVAVARPSVSPGQASLEAGGALAPLMSFQTHSMDVVLLTPPADLWERIRRGFAMPDLNNDLVRDREQWYGSRPDYIQRMTERSSKYLFHIVEELERRNMPTELALLPFIESAFNPQAISSAKAVGMWQFMPATGKHFELKQNAFRDDRRDVLASTRAALDYLQKLYGMFGDWQLALAAYNWGEGSVQRAIDKNVRAGLGTGYQDLNMPVETRQYVPKLQAIKNIVAAPRGFGTVLPVIENHPYFQTVSIARDIDVALAAKLAQVKLEDFKALNPSANRPVILAAGTPQILLPWDNAAVFEANLRAHAGGQLATWTAWQAPATLKPADAARRVGMTEPQLREINQIPSGVVIQAGSTLLVTRSARMQQDVTEHVAENAQLSLGPQPPPSPLPSHSRTRSGRRATATAGVAVERHDKASASSATPSNGARVSAGLRTSHALAAFATPVARRSAKPARPDAVVKSTVHAKGHLVLVARR